MGNDIHRVLVGVLLMLALWSCSKQEATRYTVAWSDITPVYFTAEVDTVIEIKNWLAIGPFNFNTYLTEPSQSFSRNDMRRYGGREGVMDSIALAKLQKRGVRTFLIDALSPQIKLFKYVSGRIDNKSNFYLVARIHSSKKKDVTLIMDGSNSYAAWLNGDKLLEVRHKYNVNKAGDRFVSVVLQEGENTLFVKVNRGTNNLSWDFIGAIASPYEGKRIFQVNYTGDFVVNPLCNNSIEVYTGPYRSGRVDVLDEKAQIVAGGLFDNQNTNKKPVTISGLDRIDDGFYKGIVTK